MSEVHDKLNSFFNLLARLKYHISKNRGSTTPYVSIHFVFQIRYIDRFCYAPRKEVKTTNNLKRME